MKIVIFLLLGLVSLAASAPQSRFGISRHQSAGAPADDTGDTTEAAHVAGGHMARGKTTELDQDVADWGKTSEADLDSAGPDAGADADDTKKDTPGKAFVVDGQMKPAFGLDFAKERRRLSNLRRHSVKPNNEEGEESAVTATPHDTHAAAPASGHRRAGAGQQDSNDDKAATPALGHRRAGAGQQGSNNERVATLAPGHRRAGAGQEDSNDQESTPAKDDGSQNPPASNPRRRFHSTSSSSSLVSDASQGNKEGTAKGSIADSSDQPSNETNFERRRPALRRRQQSTPAPSDGQSQDESSDAGSNTQPGATDSTSPAEKQKPAAVTPSGGSMKERLERYRQRQSGRLGAASQTGAGDGSIDAQTSDAQSDAKAESDATAKSNATPKSNATVKFDAAAAAVDAPSTSDDSQNSGDDRLSA